MICIASRDLGLIALTGLSAQDDRAQHTASVVDHYFEKPIDVAALLACLPPPHHDTAPDRQGRAQATRVMR